MYKRSRGTRIVRWILLSKPSHVYLFQDSRILRNSPLVPRSLAWQSPRRIKVCLLYYTNSRGGFKIIVEIQTKPAD